MPRKLAVSTGCIARRYTELIAAEHGGFRAGRR